MLRFGGRIIAGAVVTFACLLTAGSQAQDAVLADLYGSGVHAYFSGDLQQALADLTSAIDAGSEDPRAYYFRGLVERRMGMEDAAEEDFARGAEREATAVDRFYPISRSLERVQGYDRLMIERHRAKARAILYRKNQAHEEQRYQQIQRAEAEVLRTPEHAPAPALPTEQPAAPEPQKPADAMPADANLFGEPAEAEQPAAGGGDLFGEEPAAEEAPAEAKPAEADNPFGADAEEAAAPKAEAEAPKAEADDVFGGEAEAPKAEAEPKAEAAADGNPFADDAGQEEPKAEKEPAEEQPAEKETAEEQPAEEADENPFD